MFVSKEKALKALERRQSPFARVAIWKRWMKYAAPSFHKRRTLNIGRFAKVRGVRVGWHRDHGPAPHEEE